MFHVDNGTISLLMIPGLMLCNKLIYLDMHASKDALKGLYCKYTLKD